MPSGEVGEISAAEVLIITPRKVNYATDTLFDAIALWVQQLQCSLRHAPDADQCVSGKSGRGCRGHHGKVHD
jgi:hypothetical protein